jgi:hypothetical protein
MAVPRRARNRLKVHLDGDEIVVSKRGTVFLIAFRLAPHERRLVVTRNWLPNFASRPLDEFRARAAQLALNKARELGWGVVVALASRRTRSGRAAPGVRRRVTGVMGEEARRPGS